MTDNTTIDHAAGKRAIYIGCRIAAARRDIDCRFMPQKRLAQRCNMSVPRLADIENGRDEPTQSELVRIANVCKRSPAWFMPTAEELQRVTFDPRPSLLNRFLSRMARLFGLRPSQKPGA